jgi:hypothetical protein
MNDLHSFLGFVFMMGSGAIFWSSKRQPTIALLMTEAEYMASTQATKEAIWMTKLIKESSSAFMFAPQRFYGHCSPYNNPCQTPLSGLPK